MAAQPSSSSITPHSFEPSANLQGTQPVTLSRSLMKMLNSTGSLGYTMNDWSTAVVCAAVFIYLVHASSVLTENVMGDCVKSFSSQDEAHTLLSP